MTEEAALSSCHRETPLKSNLESCARKIKLVTILLPASSANAGKGAHLAQCDISGAWTEDLASS